jgi:multiple sugar transport system ATP-binding protein
MFPESCIEVDVDVTELMGAEIYLYLNSFDKTTEDGSNKFIPKDPTKITARVSSRSTSRAGDKIQVAIDVSRIHIFDKDTERCIVH